MEERIALKNLEDGEWAIALGLIEDYIESYRRMAMDLLEYKDWSGRESSTPAPGLKYEIANCWNFPAHNITFSCGLGRITVYDDGKFSLVGSVFDADDFDEFYKIYRRIIDR